MIRSAETAAMTASACLLLFLLAFVPAEGEAGSQGRPGPKDKCPVCGMFVAKYPDWTAGVLFRDGTSAFFDGPKDLFRYLADVRRYTPGRARPDIKSFFVTDYYSQEQTDGQTASYVIGSDVYGPMGKELVPFAREAHALEFLKDHRGTAILRFRDVSAEKLKDLE